MAWRGGTWPAVVGTWLQTAVLVVAWMTQARQVVIHRKLLVVRSDDMDALVWHPEDWGCNLLDAPVVAIVGVVAVVAVVEVVGVVEVVEVVEVVAGTHLVAGSLDHLFVSPGYFYGADDVTASVCLLYHVAGLHWLRGSVYQTVLRYSQLSWLKYAELKFGPTNNAAIVGSPGSVPYCSAFLPC